MYKTQYNSKTILLITVILLTLTFSGVSFAQDRGRGEVRDDRGRNQPSPADCEAYARNYARSGIYYMNRARHRVGTLFLPGWNPIVT